MTKIRAKFNCRSVTYFSGGMEANLSAVYGKEGENADYAKATPSGELKIRIDAGTPAVTFFEHGKDYYLTFELAV